LTHAPGDPRGTRAFRRVFAILALMMLGSTAVMPSVLAQDFTGQKSKVIDLVPDPAFRVDRTVNLANATKVGASQLDLEKDAMRPEFNEPGRFLGPYVRTSKFRFTSQKGGVFSFESTFNFTKQQVMNGASTYWVRWPIDPSEYRVLCIQIVDYFAFTVGGPLNNDYVRCAGHTTEPPGGLLGFAFFDEGLGDWAIRDGTGLYVKEWNWLKPGRNYTFRFLGQLVDDVSPSVWVTVERYQLAAKQTYEFSDFVRGVSHTESLPLYPAFAFNFLAGIGESGLTSYRIPFTGRNTTFMFSQEYEPFDACTDHFSFYIPFIGADNVTWTFFVNATYGDTGGNPSPYLRNTWTTTTKRNFVLTSSPLSVQGMFDEINEICLPQSLTWGIQVYASKPVVMLGYVPDDPADIDLPWRLSTATHTTNPFYAWGSGLLSIFSTLDLVTPVFINADFTSGAWADVTITDLYQVYDFGWGRGYLFPGEVDIILFLEDGRQLPFNNEAGAIESGPGSESQPCSVIGPVQSVPVISEISKPIADWLNQFICFILNIAGNIIGFIQTIAQRIWEGIKAIGEWISSAFMSFIDVLVDIATSVVDIVVNIATAFLVSLPFVLVLFVAARGMPDILEAKTRIVTAARRERPTEMEGQEP